MWIVLMLLLLEQIKQLGMRHSIDMARGNVSMMIVVVLCIGHLLLIDGGANLCIGIALEDDA